MHLKKDKINNAKILSKFDIDYNIVNFLDLKFTKVKFSEMIKLVTFTLFFFISTQIRGQLCWSDSTQLKWSDFMGLPSPSSNLRALSTTSIECDYFFSDTCLNYKVTALFFQQDSWALDSSKYLLEHEKMHFNLTEIYARKIRKYLSQAKGKSDFVIRNAISSLITKMHQKQALYDKQRRC